ncbi:MAG: hypothetical protein ACRD0A_05120, partial [Acidimicrobiales bacterium]
METTINNPEHFELRKTLNADNWRALLRVGEAVNTRFLEALGEGAPGVPDATTLQAIVLPTVHHGQRAPGLRFSASEVGASGSKGSCSTGLRAGDACRLGVTANPTDGLQHTSGSVHDSQVCGGWRR